MSRPTHPTPPPPPPSPVSSWGASHATTRRYGYPPPRLPSDRERIAHLERLADWLAECLAECLERMDRLAAEPDR